MGGSRKSRSNLPFCVTQCGINLTPDKYTWDETTRTFTTEENFLVIDVQQGIDNITFNTNAYCRFNTWSNFNFNTGAYCTFDTGNSCTFNTLTHCFFRTGINCLFDTGSDCIFNCLSNCTFNTEDNCIFKTSSGCAFRTGKNCTFNTGGCCSFEAKGDGILIRRDIIEVQTIYPEVKMILNDSNVAGWMNRDEIEKYISTLNLHV
jgi:hypothetical protein